MKTATVVEMEVKEAILEGMAVELIPEPDGTGYYLRVGTLEWTVEGLSAAECFLKVADILSAPVPEGKASQ